MFVLAWTLFKLASFLLSFVACYPLLSRYQPRSFQIWLGRSWKHNRRPHTYQVTCSPGCFPVQQLTHCALSNTRTFPAASCAAIFFFSFSLHSFTFFAPVTTFPVPNRGCWSPGHFRFDLNGAHTEVVLQQLLPVPLWVGPTTRGFENLTDRKVLPPPAWVC